MGYVVYVMPEVREAVSQSNICNLDDLINRLSQREPDPRSLPYFEPLGQNWFKKRYSKYRLIASLETVTLEERQVPVVVLVDLLRREEPAYGNGKAEHLESRYRTRINADQEQIREAAERSLQGTAAPPLPPLPDEYLILLERLRPREDVDALYLSENFCCTYLKLTRDTERTDVYRALCDIANYHNEELHTLLWHTRESSEVRYVRLHDPDKGLNHIFVLGLLSRNWSNDEIQNQEQRIQECWEQLEKHLLSREASARSCSYTDPLSQLSERAFPIYLLADEDLWQDLWKEREVFLALSLEELAHLETMLSGEELPAVIEGRAGSGKTTLLIYYAAERLAQKLSSGAEAINNLRMLYVTHSERLFHKAQNLIQKLQSRISQEHTAYGKSLVPEYKTYHAFALERLPEDRRERFYERSRKGGWLDFSRFSDLLRGHGPDGLRDPFGRSRECNPEIVWFVLRSYIKGYKIHEEGENRWLSADEYMEEDTLPRRDRQVSIELYQEVWHHVWPWYKRLTIPCDENKGRPAYWDDLDLAWEVLLHSRKEAPRYAVLICDEVQDLTRLELASLLSSLIWTQYDLKGLWMLYNPHLPLPLIVAGDAHQTVNPSCFRWQRVSADISKALVRHITHIAQPSIPRLELTCNYRNARSIAQLCNAVQELREQTLGQAGCLQKLWRLADEQPNQRIRRLILSQKENSLDNLLQNGVLLIGPEEDDPGLATAQSFWNTLGYSHPPQGYVNYVTPAEIKGLEHDYVAIVGFGSMFQALDLQDFWNWKEAIDNPHISEARRFQAEYFLNRLYVALSRAREQLWIVETQEGWNAFWARLEERLSQRSTESEEVAFLYSDGDEAELGQVFQGNSLELAMEFERLAHDQKSPEHAERSAFYFGRSNRPIDRGRMLAWMKYYRGELLAAAEAMWPIDRNQASDWFWEAAAWQELANRPVTPVWRRDLATPICILQEQSDPEALMQLISELQKLTSVMMEQRVSEKWKIWEKVFLVMLESASKLSLDYQELKQQAYTFTINYTPKCQEKLAELAFQLKKYGEAAMHWESAGMIEHKNYFTAKAETSLYPANLRLWESAANPERILEEFKKHSEIPLEKEDRRRVATAAAHIRDYKTALKLMAGIDDGWVHDLWKNKIIGSKVERGADSSVFRETAKLISCAFEGYKENVKASELEHYWSNFLLDLIIDSELCMNTTSVHGLLMGIVSGFALGASPETLAGRLRNSYNARQSDEKNWLSLREHLRRVVYMTSFRCSRFGVARTTIHMQTRWAAHAWLIWSWV
jgi:superfamily I DNA/RNA helicase